MYMKNIVLLCFNLWCVYLHLCDGSGVGSLSYYCFPNDTIWVENTYGYTWFRADANDSTTCTVTPQNDQLKLTGCNKDTIITLVLSNRTDTSTHIIYGRRTDGGGSDLMTYKIACAEILSSGITRDVSAAITPIVPASFQQTVSPSFTLTSFIYTDSTKETRATVARSGDQLYWNIVGPVEYDHKPEECIVYAGVVITPSVSNKTIISAGCTLDDSLVTDFSFVNGSGNEVFSTIYAFRFYSSPYVTFECKVRVCPENETDCQINCSNRRRRSEGNPLTDDQEMNTIRTQIQIRIDDPMNFELKDLSNKSESTSIESEVWWLLGVALLLKAV